MPSAFISIKWITWFDPKNAENALYKGVTLQKQ